MLLNNQAALYSGATPAGKIVQDTQAVLQSGKALMMEKNQGEKLQTMYVAGREAGRELQAHPQAQSAIGSVKDSVTGTAASQTMDTARSKLQSARNLVMLLIRSGEFREAIMELFQLFGEALTWKAKQAAATGALPAATGATFATPSTVQIQTVVTPGLLPGETVTTVAQLPLPATGGGAGAASMPTKRRTMVRARIRTVLKTLASTEAYRRGVKNFFSMIDQINGLADSRKLSGAAAATQESVHVQTLLDQAKLLLQEFAGGRSVDPFFNNAKGLFYLIRDDVALRGYLQEWRDYIMESQANPAILDDDMRLKVLLKKGRSYASNVRTHDYAQNTIREGREPLAAVRADPTTTRFVNDLNTLFRDLFLNQEGRPALKLETLGALKNVLVGMLLDELRYIRLPRITGANEKMQWAVDGISLNALNILPENIHLKTVQSTTMKPRNVQPGTPSTFDKSKGFIKIKITNLAARIDNIQYWVKRLRAPHIEDSGVASVILGDKRGLRGLRLSIYVATTYGAQYDRFFHIERVKCHIERMKLKVFQSQHKMLLTVLSPFINAALRRRTETAVEENILKSVKKLEYRLQQFFETSSLGTAAPSVVQKLIPTTGTRVQTAHGVVNPATYATATAAAPTAAH